MSPDFEFHLRVGRTAEMLCDERLKLSRPWQHLRTMFTAFHHFRAAQACAVLADAVRQRQGIGIFEATQRRALALPLKLVVLIVTPFIRPFRWSRLLWTYLIPWYL